MVRMWYRLTPLCDDKDTARSTLLDERKVDF
jgi:hypothetical protein